MSRRAAAAVLDRPRPGRRSRAGVWRRGWLITMASAAIVAAAEPVPVSVQTAPGRFEVAAIDPSTAHAVAAVAEEGWRALAAPLALPDAFPLPVYVRIGAPTEPRDAAAFRVTVEPAGVVSVRIPATGLDLTNVRRALVQGLLLRLAVAAHGVTERLAVPLWLEQAALGWWQTHADAAQLDAMKQLSEPVPPPTLFDLFAWTRGAPEPRALTLGAFWLLVHLQEESGAAREWATFLQRVLGGENEETALAACYPGRFADPDERELWWRTGHHQAVRARTLPMLDAADSNSRLAALVRFVFGGTREDADLLLSLRDVLAHRDEPIVAAELTRRAAELDRLVGALHPFYRNAGLSLGAALRERPRNARAREALCTAFDQDWRDAVALHQATDAALDALEARRR